MTINPYEPPQNDEAPHQDDRTLSTVAPLSELLIAGSLGFGFLLGASLWFWSFRITGHWEPWDSPSLYYSGGLFAAGFLSTLVCPSKFWPGPLGIYLGQVAYIEFIYSAMIPKGDPVILPAFIGVAIFGAVPTFLGAAVAWAVWPTTRSVARRNDA